MSTIDQNTTDKNVLMNEELYQNNEQKQTNREIAEQGFTVRNGHDPNKPNPDERITNEDDLDDLNDDFHADRDLEGDDVDEDEEIDLDGDERIVNDEFDNPSDAFENTFNETEEDLEDIDQEEEEIEEEDDYEYQEDDIQEEENEEDYPANDPRKF